MRLRLNGWQRLWILVSVLYLLLVGSLAYAFWPTLESTRHRAEFIERMPADVRKQINGAYASQWEADQEAKDVSRTLPPGFVLKGREGRLQVLPNGAVFRVVGSEFEQFRVLAAYVDVVDAEVKAQRWATARTVALAGLVPCLALYALGWAIGWVYRGFRSNRTDPGA